MPTNLRGRRSRASAREGAPRGRRLALVVVALLAGAAVLIGVVIATTGTPTPGGTASPAPTATPTPTQQRDVLADVDLNPLEERRIQELRDFAAWLERNDAEGFVGELGWPKGEADIDAWNALADKWYSVAEQEGLWTTIWAAGSEWSDGYPLTVYTEDEGEGLEVANPQAPVLESHLGGEARAGVNLAGLEFGTENGFSNTQPGELGTDYFAEPPSSYAYLAERGVELVRLPFRWERLQPSPFGELDADHLALLRTSLDDAAEHGVDVILDLHNYGFYETAAGTLQVGTDQLPADALTDVWLQLSDEFAGHEALAAYGLMNEPHSFAAPADRSAAEVWEDISQRTLTALRDAGDDTMIMVAGYDWSSLERWERTHPDAWVEDPAGNFRYEAHHYWDADGSGTYPRPFDIELIELPAP